MPFDPFYANAAIIIVLSFLLWMIFYRPIHNINKSLKRAHVQLSNEWTVQGNAEFFLKEEYKLFTNKILKMLWDRYLNSINSYDGYYKYANIYEHFSPQQTLEDETNVSLASFAPFILLVIGTMFTSITLVYYNYLSKLTMVIWTKAAIMVIAVVILSLCLAIYYKSITYRTRKQFGKFSQWITSKHQSMPTATEQISDIRRTMGTYNNDQLKFYAKLTDHISDNTKKAIQPFLESTNNVIESFVQATTERQIESMHHLAEYFAENTTQLYVEQIQKISETTASMAEIQTKTAITLQSVSTIYTDAKDCISQVSDNSKSILDQYDSHLTYVKAMNNELSLSVKQLEDLVEYIRNNSRNQNFTIENLSVFQQDLLDVSEKSRVSMQKFFDDFEDHYSSSIVALRAAANDMLKSGEMLKGSYSEMVIGVDHDIAKVFTIFEENLSTISVHISQSINDLQDAIDDLPGVIRAINTKEKIIGRKGTRHK